MLCPACGTTNDDGTTLCVTCNEILDPDLAADVFGDDTDDSIPDLKAKPVTAAPIPSDDDHFVMAHTLGGPMGTTRVLNTGELARPENLLRADAVLRLVGGTVPDGLSPFEHHVAEMIDGVRTVARIRKRTGLSGDDVRIALGMLRDRGLLEIVGLLEPGEVSADEPSTDFEEDPTDAGMDLSDIEAEHGPSTVSPRDPEVPHDVLAELRGAVQSDDEDPSPF